MSKPTYIAGQYILTGTGPPTAPALDGAIYLRTDGPVGESFYLRARGAWAAVTVPELEENLYIQNAAPSSPPETYLWIQTGLGGGGTDMTFWVEDGL